MSKIKNASVIAIVSQKLARSARKFSGIFQWKFVLWCFVRGIEEWWWLKIIKKANYFIIHKIGIWGKKNRNWSYSCKFDSKIKVDLVICFIFYSFSSYSNDKYTMIWGLLENCLSSIRQNMIFGQSIFDFEMIKINWTVQNRNEHFF